MKLSTLVLLMMLGGLGYYAVKHPEVWQAPSPAAGDSRDETASPSRRVRCYQADLVPVAGRIVSIERGGLTIECAAPALPRKPDFSAPGWQVDAMTGNAGTKAMAKIAAQQEAKYNAAVADAAKKVSGVVLLFGHPQETQMRVGMPVSVVAAPLGGRSYTMAYEIAPEPPGAWMRKSGTVLDRR